MEERLLDPQVAECVGLWLAEGDNKTKAEITFTNNCWDLIDLFYNTINKLFSDHSYNPRIYIYSKNGEKVKIPYENCVVKYYVHKRATRPYFILRFASVEMVKRWKKIVEDLLNTKEVFHYILRGFFAGEGNIKEGKKSCRTLRISQGEQKEFIDNLLNEFGIKYSFRLKDRNYYISGKWNWDIFAKHKLADLHPDKKERFCRVYNEFKQEHYPHNHLIKEVFLILDKPKTARELSKLFNRSFARIQDILIELKKQGKINNFRVGSTGYWTNDKNLIIISKVKEKYLLFLNNPKYISDCAKSFKVCWKSSFRRLKELKKLNLVYNDNNRKWIKLDQKKKILAI